MKLMQELLDEEAELANKGDRGDKYKNIHIQIKEMRGDRPPVCWGDDDCSTFILMHCPWRIDCGPPY